MPSRFWTITVALAAAGLAGCLGEDEPEGIVSFVSFTTTPDTLQEGTASVVCWQVEGAGAIPHAAVHLDTVSRAQAATFTAYQGPAFYPDNATEVVTVTLPVTLCTGVTPPTGAERVYLRAHAFGTDGPPGIMSLDEAVLPVAAS